MTRRIARARSLVVALLLSPIPLSAHHSFGAEYDVEKPITLTGVLTKIEWTNPHSHLYLDVTDGQGNVVNWQFEGYPPPALLRIGWKRDLTMKVGDTITVFGWRARDGGNWAHSREITLPGGDKMISALPQGPAMEAALLPLT